MSPIAISWVLSTVSGYGIYGLQIAMQYLRRGGDTKDIILTSNPSVSTLLPLEQIKLEPMMALAIKLSKFLQDKPEETLVFKHPVLHGCSSDFTGFSGQDRIWGAPNVGCAAIEHLFCSEHGRNIAKNYDMFIAISRWNAEYLKSLNVGPVFLRHQGIDPTLFHPAPSSGLYKNRFVVFSGGKFEFRKGQDIVTAAFKIFNQKHPDSLLITAWQNLSTVGSEAFSLAGHCQTTPMADPNFGIQVKEWLQDQGLPDGSFIDLPFTHNLLMPSVLRECDMAIFPNRCEGGTNLVAMESMACGVPTWVSYNTGQKDLVDLIGCGAFKTQKAVIQPQSMPTTEDWGETDVDEVVAAMEYAYTNRAEAKREAIAVAERMKDWSWSGLNEKLLQTVFENNAAS